MASIAANPSGASQRKPQTDSTKAKSRRTPWSTAREIIDALLCKMILGEVGR